MRKSRNCKAVVAPEQSFLHRTWSNCFRLLWRATFSPFSRCGRRGLRGLLIAREKALFAGKAETKLQRAVWQHANQEDLHNHFERLMGFPFAAFDSYSGLDFLQCLASAIRHGDGSSAKRVHALCPGLWWNWIDPYEPFVAGPFVIPASGGGPRHPPFGAITLPEALLEQMIQAVLWFWEDLDNLRCASFRRKHHTVDVRLKCWPGGRAGRQAKRVWSAAVPIGSGSAS